MLGVGCTVKTKTVPWEQVRFTLQESIVLLHGAKDSQLSRMAWLATLPLDRDLNDVGSWI